MNYNEQLDYSIKTKQQIINIFKNDPTQEQEQEAYELFKTDALANNIEFEVFCDYFYGLAASK